MIKEAWEFVKDLDRGEICTAREGGKRAKSQTPPAFGYVAPK